jgi:hypothetical protein
MMATESQLEGLVHPLNEFLVEKHQFGLDWIESDKNTCLATFSKGNLRLDYVLGIVDGKDDASFREGTLQVSVGYGGKGREIFNSSAVYVSVKDIVTDLLNGWRREVNADADFYKKCAAAGCLKMITEEMADTDITYTIRALNRSIDEREVARIIWNMYDPQGKVPHSDPMGMSFEGTKKYSLASVQTPDFPDGTPYFTVVAKGSDGIHSSLTFDIEVPASKDLPKDCNSKLLHKAIAQVRKDLIE